MADRETTLTPEEIAGIDAFWAAAAPKLDAAARDALPWSGGTAARDALAQVVEAERSNRGFLTKSTFNEVLKWGFGRTSQLEAKTIHDATREAFAALADGDATGAVKRLSQLPGIGVSRATKLLALSDQQNLGIYDSHAAAALHSIKVAGKPIIAIPPGQSKALRGMPTAPPSRLAREYPKYTAVLQRLLENAEQDKKHGQAFSRVADVERALFGMHRNAASISADSSGSGGGDGSATRSALSAAIAGTVADARDLAKGKISATEFGKRRTRDAGLASVERVVTRYASRVGKATDGRIAHAQRGGRAIAVNTVMGTIADVGPLARGEITLRDFGENRALDGAEVGGNYVAGAAVGAALLAAPVDVPAIAGAAAAYGTGAVVSRALRPVRKRVLSAREGRQRPAPGSE